jgi:hypothetical protein
MIRTVGALIGLSLLLPAAALAQGAPPPAGGGMTMQAFQAKHRARMMALDTNHDGRISMAEFAAKPGRDGQQRDPSRPFARFDANHDGFLDVREIDAMDAAKFGKKDRNGDGVVSRDEHGQHGRGAGAYGQPDGMARPAPTPQP